MILVVCAVGLAGAQVPDRGGDLQREKMLPLEMLVGKWKGTGSYEMGGRRSEFAASENVEWAAGKTALFVRGLHTVQAGEREIVVHDAAGFIRWDPKDKVHRMATQLATGASGEFEMIVTDKGFTWATPGPGGGSARYTMTLSEKGEWVEKGEMSTDGKTWTPFFEMRLARVDK